MARPPQGHESVDLARERIRSTPEQRVADAEMFLSWVLNT